MRINASSKLTVQDVMAAAKVARDIYGQDIYVEEVKEGKRGAIQFWCASQNGRFATNRHYGSARAASWVAWGYLIGTLFALDPDAIVGQYRGRADFVSKVIDEHDRWYLRQSLGIAQRSDTGSDIRFVELTGYYRT